MISAKLSSLWKWQMTLVGMFWQFESKPVIGQLVRSDDLNGLNENPLSS